MYLYVLIILILWKSYLNKNNFTFYRQYTRVPLKSIF